MNSKNYSKQSVHRNKHRGRRNMREAEKNCFPRGASRGEGAKFEL